MYTRASGIRICEAPERRSVRCPVSFFYIGGGELISSLLAIPVTPLLSGETVDLNSVEYSLVFSVSVIVDVVMVSVTRPSAKIGDGSATPWVLYILH